MLEFHFRVSSLSLVVILVVILFVLDCDCECLCVVPLNFSGVVGHRFQSCCCCILSITCCRRSSASASISSGSSCGSYSLRYYFCYFSFGYSSRVWLFFWLLFQSRKYVLATIPNSIFLAPVPNFVFWLLFRTMVLALIPASRFNLSIRLYLFI